MRGPSASARRLCAACALAIALQIPCGLCACAGQPHAASSSSEQASSSVARQESSSPEPSESKPEPEPSQEQQDEQSQQKSTSLLLSPADIGLHPLDWEHDWGQYYAFTYADEQFDVYYEPDNWKVFDSYKISDHDDLVTICTALLDEHPIHGSDLQSYRTAEDMAFEWEQHNLAYRLLPDDSSWKESAQNVDLDPDDQGKTFAEMYASRQ